MKITPRLGKIVATRAVNETDELMMISTLGMVVRIAAKSVSKQSRSATGVSVMSFSRSGDSLAAVAVITENKSDRVTEKYEQGEDNSYDGDAKDGKSNAATPLALLDEPTVELNARVDSHNGNGHSANGSNGSNGKSNIKEENDDES